MRRYLNSVALIFGATLFCLGRTPGPEEFLRAQMHLSPNQIADIQNGKAVATILSSPNPSDIFVFGAVYVRTKPVAYLQLMRDVNRFNKLSGYLGAGEFSKSPTMEDMAGLSLDHDDIKDLKNCRPGNCEVQLPEESMEAARASAVSGLSPGTELRVAGTTPEMGATSDPANRCGRAGKVGAKEFE